MQGRWKLCMQRGAGFGGVLMRGAMVQVTSSPSAVGTPEGDRLRTTRSMKLSIPGLNVLCRPT